MSRTTLSIIVLGAIATLLVAVFGAAVFLFGRGYFASDAQNEHPIPTMPVVMTPAVSVTPIPTLAADTATVTPISTPPATAVPQPGQTTACTDTAAFIADVSMPDGSQVAPGAPFIKIWRIKNTGTCTWNQQYQLVFAGGNTLGSLANNFLLDAIVAPGELIDLSVAFSGPTNAGTYQSDWKLQNAQGQVFGVGQNGSPLWVKIVIPEGLAVTISGAVYQDWNENG
ncbi:MAG: hypothetical protein KC413_12145, partial [Anaerolineales bacterium]|nr:hypothetical protein [Anaerolineales bacterium]